MSEHVALLVLECQMKRINSKSKDQVICTFRGKFWKKNDMEFF